MPRPWACGGSLCACVAGLACCGPTAPTDSLADAPTASPTAEVQSPPQNADSILSWAEVESVCNAGIDANMTLSSAFQMSAYTGLCDFSGRTLVLDCQNQTLNANQAGRFFYGSGGASSLLVYRCALTNGREDAGGAIQARLGDTLV